MRKKIMFGMIALLALVAALGERYFNRAVGQDVALPKAPSADKPAELNQLFDSIKKDLEKKGAPTFPAFPPKKDESTVPPTLPSLPVSKDEKVLITPPSPMGDAPKPTLPRVVSEQPVETPKQDVAPPPLDGKKADAKPEAGLPSFPASPKKLDSPAASVNGGEKKPPLDSLPPLTPQTAPAKLEPIKPADLNALPLSPAKDSALPNAKSNTAPQAVTLPKNSPWSLNVVMVDGQTIVTAVVNKKHEFKILCQTLDLQTGKGMLKASGEVQINGDAFHGTCDHLSITLMEDRLLLEGKALVSIDRTSANVSDATPASFELKGETLNLRISELATSSVYDFRAVSNHEPRGRVVTASLKLEGTQWTPYGRLRAVKSNDNMWSLEGSNGVIIAYVLAREGGSLERYVGQNISVYGTREREHGGQPVLRVTHIALP